MKHASLEIDHGVGDAVLLALVNSPARQARRKIGRPQQSTRRTVRVAVGHLEIFDDLALVPDVVAGGHHVDAEIEKLFGQRRRNPKSRRGVFAVGDDEVSRMLFDELRQTFLDNRAGRDGRKCRQ